MSNTRGGKSDRDKQEQSWWDKVFGTNGLVGLIVALVALATFLYTSHMWPFADGSSDHGATPGTQTNPVQTPPSSAVTTRATDPPAVPQLAAQSAVGMALLTQTDLGSAFADLRGIAPQSSSSSDYQCQPSGQPPKLATAQILYGTNGITASQADQENATNYSSVTERANAYSKGDTTALAQYLESYQVARNNCTDSYNGITLIYQVISNAPSLCDQSFVTTGNFSNPAPKDTKPLSAAGICMLMLGFYYSIILVSANRQYMYCLNRSKETSGWKR